MRKTLSIIVVLLAASLMLAACGGGSTNDSSTEAGKNLFAESVIGTQAGCITCHSLSEGVVLVGPSMAGIGSRVDEAFVRESILDPNATLTDGYTADIMPNTWGDELSGEQVDQLVAYLLSLK